MGQNRAMINLPLLRWHSDLTHIAVNLQFDPRNLWVGVLWNYFRRAEGKLQIPERRSYHVYIGIPLLQLHILVWRFV